MLSTPPYDLSTTAQAGLTPLATHPQKVVVVGAGMAGLVAAYELQRAGHHVAVLEATHRVGGRVLTLREAFTDDLYGEAGAMRLPVTDRLTHTYIERFRLQTMPFSMAGPNALVHLRGHRLSRGAVDSHPSILGLDLAGPEGHRTVLEHWHRFLRQTGDRLKEDPAYWEELHTRYGDYSLYDFLRKERWSADAITSFAVLESLEPLLATSFLEILQIELQWSDARMTQLIGGMDHLPTAFMPSLEEHLLLGAEMVAVDQDANSVTIHHRSGPDTGHLRADFGIITIPLPAMRFVDVLQPFSPAKHAAIRQVHYTNAVKVFLQCRRRFWEEDDGIFGGATVTDLPNHLIYYPEHGRPTKKGVLMASFSYGEEANRWAALSPDERIREAVRFTAKIHPQIKQEFEVGDSKAWGNDRFAGGASALFHPGQHTRLYQHMITPEGRIYFAGEHTSLRHGWIEGAVESGLRAAREVHARCLEAP